MRRVVVVISLCAALAALGGCRQRRQPVTAPSPPAAEPMPAPASPAPVAPPSQDFAPAPPSDEVLSSDITELNRIARERGWIADAFFDFDSFVLTPDAQEALQKSARWLRDHPDYAMTIEGHCDERGTEQYNLALGEQRANTARTYLISLGVDGARMNTVSYGEERPFDEGHDEEALAKNRRAHLVIGPWKPQT